MNACESESYLGCLLAKRPGLLAKTKAGLRKCLGLLAGAAVDACASESEWAACESKLSCLREQPRILVKAKATANDGESKLSCLRKLTGLFACEYV